MDIYSPSKKEKATPPSAFARQRVTMCRAAVGDKLLRKSGPPDTLVARRTSATAVVRAASERWRNADVDGPRSTFVRAYRLDCSLAHCSSHPPPAGRAAYASISYSLVYCFAGVMLLSTIRSSNATHGWDCAHAATSNPCRQ